MRLALFSVLFLLTSCHTDKSGHQSGKEGYATGADSESMTAYEKAVADPNTQFRGTTVDTRFLVPEGYDRVIVEETSFANFLRKLPLKVPGSEVIYYDGRVKRNDNLYSGVIELPIGQKDLHQCADAIMRLRAEHLWLQKKYDDIHFNFTNGMTVAYSEWMKGRRMIIDGNKTKWDNQNNPSNTYADFWEYMELIFMYAGTLSLSKEMKSVDVDDMQIGDVFIQGGSPGHAVVIADMAEHESSGEKIIILAQSFMPAQEAHIIANQNSKMSPWYKVQSTGSLKLPEWQFKWDEVKQF